MLFRLIWIETLLCVSEKGSYGGREHSGPAPPFRGGYLSWWDCKGTVINQNCHLLCYLFHLSIENL